MLLVSVQQGKASATAKQISIGVLWYAGQYWLLAYMYAADGTQVTHRLANERETLRSPNMSNAPHDCFSRHGWLVSEPFTGHLSPAAGRLLRRDTVPQRTAAGLTKLLAFCQGRLEAEAWGVRKRWRTHFECLRIFTPSHRYGASSL